jgi:hypothetical protein
VAVIRFLVFSNIWIALGAGSVALLAQHLFTGSQRFTIPVLAFLCTLAGYIMLRLFRLPLAQQPQGQRQRWISRHRQLLPVLLMACLAALGALIPALSATQLVVLALAGAITFLYGYPFSPAITGGLRMVPGLKIFLIGFSWMMVTAAMPVNPVLLFDAHRWLFCGAELLFIVAITIPFDIRDLPHDPAKQRTIPQRLGIGPSRVVSAAVLLLASGLLWVALRHEGETIRWGIPATLLPGLPLVLVSHPNRPELFYTGLLDGLILLHGAGGVLLLSL